MKIKESSRISHYKYSYSINLHVIWKIGDDKRENKNPKYECYVD